jgi:hypothetical protein
MIKFNKKIIKKYKMIRVYKETHEIITNLAKTAKKTRIKMLDIIIKKTNKEKNG